jgi:transposase InsO family protein
MGFRECTKMDQRRGLARLVLEDGVSLSEAARIYGVSRPTARLWVGRARESGLADICEESRRPEQTPRITDDAIALQLLEAKVLRPFWGAKKLLAWVWPEGAPIALRTANRILARSGLARPSPAKGEFDRFERGAPNELWQMDFKGMRYPRLPYEALSVIDDCSRFCVGFLPVPAQTVEAVWQALWAMFGEYGLPQCILSDNGPAFRAQATRLPGALDARLWRLGVATTHGRPYHPQTQGKVERFHRTVQLELGPELRQPDALQAAAVYEGFRCRYNWERPHEALAMKTPGAIYKSSLRPRPDKLPEHSFPDGATIRKIDGWGNFGFKGQHYKAGRGIRHERIELREGPHDYEVLYCGIVLGNLKDFEL